MVQVYVDLNKAKQKLSQQAHQRGKYALANQALADMNQFVPMKEGILRLSGTVDEDASYIRWNTPYARAQFYGFVGRGAHRVYNYTTPGTSRRWDLRAKSRYMNDWIRAYMEGAGY